MRVLIVASVLLLSACATGEQAGFSQVLSLDWLNEIYHNYRREQMGYAPYDPCLQCGERWIFLRHAGPLDPYQYTDLSYDH